MLRHVLQHNTEAARELYAELAPDPRAGLRRAGKPGALRALIDRLDQLVADSGLAPRLRDHGIARGRHPDAGQRGDEADAAAGEQSRARSTKSDARRLYEAAW